MLAGLYHIGPSGIRGAADAFLHGAGNALGGITHAFHDLEELGKGAAGLFKNATYVVRDGHGGYFDLRIPNG